MNIKCTILLIIVMTCVTEDILAGLIYRSDPEPGIHSLGAVRDLSVGIWFDGENVRSVTFDLNGTRIVRPSRKRDGFLDVSFSGNVWSWGSNIVYVTFQDSGGAVMSRESLIYQIVNPLSHADSTPEETEQGLPSGVWTYEHSQSNAFQHTTQIAAFHLSGARSGNYVIFRFVTELSPQGRWGKYPELLGNARSLTIAIRRPFDNAQRNGNVINLVGGEGRLIDVEPESARQAAIDTMGDLLGSPPGTLLYKNEHLYYEGSELQSSK
jgi:hypothetical protein